MMMKLKQKFYQIDSVTASLDIYKLVEVEEVGRSMSKSIILQIFWTQQENKILPVTIQINVKIKYNLE